MTRVRWFRGRRRDAWSVVSSCVQAIDTRPRRSISIYKHTDTVTSAINTLHTLARILRTNRYL